MNTFLSMSKNVKMSCETLMVILVLWRYIQLSPSFFWFPPPNLAPNGKVFQIAQNVEKFLELLTPLPQPPKWLPKKFGFKWET